AEGARGAAPAGGREGQGQAGRRGQGEGRLVSWFDRLRQGLARTRSVIAESLGGEAEPAREERPGAPARSRPANWEMDWDELELAPIAADAGGKLAAEGGEGAEGGRARRMTFGQRPEQALPRHRA